MGEYIGGSILLYRHQIAIRKSIQSIIYLTSFLWCWRRMSLPNKIYEPWAGSESYPILRKDLRSIGRNCPEQYGQGPRCRAASLTAGPLLSALGYMGKANLFLDAYRLKDITALMEGWSGTTRPLQPRQPGSTPGPFAISFLLRYCKEGS